MYNKTQQIYINQSVIIPQKNHKMQKNFLISSFLKSKKKKKLIWKIKHHTLDILMEI